MVIDIEKLKKIGVTVRVFERPNSKGDYKGEAKEVTDIRNGFVEVFIENGQGCEAIEDVVKTLVDNRAFQQGLIEDIYNRIQTVQIVEAINRTGE